MKQIRVSIEQAHTKRREGVSQNTGKSYGFQTQPAYIWTFDPESNQEHKWPKEIELMLDLNQQPYPIGIYYLDASSIYVNRQGRLNVSPRLIPASPTKAAA